MNRNLYCVAMRSRDIWSPLIRAATWSPWSHIAPVTQDGVVWDATFAHGVARSTVPELLGRATRFQFGYLPIQSSGERFLAEQEGRRYDWTALVGIWLHRDWQEPDAWFCSELFAAACVAGRNPIIRERAGRVTPQHVYTSPIMRWYPAGTIPATFS